jgi:hypothetical protein
MPSEEEEFELIPVSPLRRLEKRLERMEKGDGAGGNNVNMQKFFSELVEIVRMNQELVDELAKANDSLRIEISKLPGRMDELISNLNELLSYIKAAGVSGGSGFESDNSSKPGMDLDPLLKKMDQLIEGNKKIVETNDSMMTNIEMLSSRMKRPGIAPMPGGQRLPPLRKPMPY